MATPDVTQQAAHPRIADPAFAAEITIRVATAPDVDVLVPLINHSYFIREGGLFTKPRTSAEDLIEALGADGSTIFVAEHEGAIAGCVRLTLRHVSGYFGMLAVAAVYQGRGLASMLIAHAELRTLAAGADTLHLECVQDLGMQPYYEALGYHEMKETPNMDWGARRPWTLAEMTKKLR